MRPRVRLGVGLRLPGSSGSSSELMLMLLVLPCLPLPAHPLPLRAVVCKCGTWGGTKAGIQSREGGEVKGREARCLCAACVSRHSP